MPDIDLIAILIAKPGSSAQVAAALKALVGPTRAEPGCVSYELFTSAESDTTFFTVEKWRSKADLDAHMLTPHIAKALAAAGDHLAAAPGIHPLQPVNI